MPNALADQRSNVGGENQTRIDCFLSGDNSEGVLKMFDCIEVVGRFEMSFQRERFIHAARHEGADLPAEIAEGNEIPLALATRDMKRVDRTMLGVVAFAGLVKELNLSAIHNRVVKFSENSGNWRVGGRAFQAQRHGSGEIVEGYAIARRQEHGELGERGVEECGC